MTPDRYSKLTDNEKLLYDEFFDFGRRVTDRLTELRDAMDEFIKLAKGPL